MLRCKTAPNKSRSQRNHQFLKTPTGICLFLRDVAQIGVWLIARQHRGATTNQIEKAPLIWAHGKKRKTENDTRKIFPR